MQEELATLCARHGVADLYAFGSRGGEIAARVRGDDARCDHPGSDLDIGVRYLADAISARSGGGEFGHRSDAEILDRLDAGVALAGELENLFAAGRVDLVDVAQSEAFVAVAIVRGELLYRSDPADQAEFELYVLRRAGDMAWHKRGEIRSSLYGEPL